MMFALIWKALLINITSAYYAKIIEEYKHSISFRICYGLNFYLILQHWCWANEACMSWIR